MAGSVGGLWFDGVSASKFPWTGTYWPGGWKLKMGLMDMRFFCLGIFPHQVEVDKLWSLFSLPVSDDRLI